MKIKLSLTVLVAGSFCFVTSMFAQSISVSPNPCCKGDTVTVSISVTCGNAEATASAIIKANSTDISLTDNGNGTWSGTYTASTAGTVSISASDDCDDTFDPVDLTVVELDDVTFVSGPSGSGWTQQYSDANRNYAALKSPTSGAVVTFVLDITPNNATAATLVSWSGATPSTDNLTATVPGTAVLGPQAVTASACNCTTMPYTVWIFWGAVSYNFNNNLDGSDTLDFGSSLGLSNLPNPRVAGYFTGTATTSVGGYTSMLAINKVEIIGTLQPSGIGNLVGDIFTFNSQSIAYNSWSYVSLNNSTGPNGGSSGGNDANLPQLTTPQSDKIFALDSPGKHYQSPVATVYGANAANFINYIYIGSVKASDAALWHSHVKAVFSGSSTVSKLTCIADSGNPTLPTTWGDSNW